MAYLGSGDLIPGYMTAREFGVHYFMTAACRLYPAILAELAAGVQHPAAWLDKPERRSSWGVNLAWVPSPALSDWCSRWNLTSESIYAWAARTVSAWADDPELRSTMEWNPPSPPEEPWRLHALKDEQLAACEALPERHRRREFMALAASHWDARVAKLVELGYEPVPAKTKVEHFEWFARFQCGPADQTLTQIAEIVNQDLKTVQAATAATARLVGLNRRPRAKGGRPKVTRPPKP